MKIFILLPLIALSISIAIARVGAHDQAQLDPRITTTSPDQLCGYEIVVRTGDVANAGTDANIRLRVSARYGSVLDLYDLRSWGKNGPGYDYFERGSTDKFSGTEGCMSPTPCRMQLESDNFGNYAGWYVDYVNVTEIMTDSYKVSHMFKVNQWLAVDEPPYQLYVYRDDCSRLLEVTAMA